MSNNSISGEWQPLVPPTPVVPDDQMAAASRLVQQRYEEKYQDVIANVKDLIASHYPSVTFLEDTHKAGYFVINCKNLMVSVDTTTLLEDIETTFGIKCKLHVNLLLKGGPVIEVMVPHQVRYSVREKYSATQLLKFAVGAACVVGATVALIMLIQSL